MKLQNLIIIFIIIIIPIVIVFSYYLKLEANTINMQTEYDEKLIEATREGMEAFVINTTELQDKFTTLGNDKRKILLSSINTVTNGLANKLGIGGTARENILQYIPAIVFIMYDGYYIYTPTYVPQTVTDPDTGQQLYYYENARQEEFKVTTEPTQKIGDNGKLYAGAPIFEVAQGKPATGTISKYTFFVDNANRTEKEMSNKAYTDKISDAKMTYKHVLKTFVPYSISYNGYIINFTLDNYVRIYGNGVSKEGYILDDDNEFLSAYSIGLGNIVDYNSINISSESLSEKIAVRKNAKKEGLVLKNEEGEENPIEEYKFIIDNGNKIYIDNNLTGKWEKFFTVSDGYKQYITDVNIYELKEYRYVYNQKGEKMYLEFEDEHADDFFIVNNNNIKEYLSVINRIDQGQFKKIIVKTNDATYEEYYQLLNRKKTDEYPNGIQDNSLYYKDPVTKKMVYYSTGDIYERNMDYSAQNYYIETYCFNNWLKSKFGVTAKDTLLNMRKTAIIDNLQENLNLSIANYSANSNLNIQIPKISEEDWDQALSNISMITFFQGVKIGLKTYNNYSIVTSLENNEFVSEDSLYFINSTEEFYHRYGCPFSELVTNNASTTGVYKNIDFKVQSYSSNDEDNYYYKHYNNSNILKPCYNCIINRNNMKTKDTSKYNESYYHAIARERYELISKTRLTDNSG